MAASSARSLLAADDEGVTPALLPDVVADGAVARDDEGEGGVVGGGGVGRLAVGDAAPEVWGRFNRKILA